MSARPSSSKIHTSAVASCTTPTLPIHLDVVGDILSIMTGHPGLSDAQLSAIHNALSDRDVPRQCSTCGRDDVHLHPCLTMLPLMNSQEPPSADNYGLACAMRTCERCGATTFHSLASLGLYPMPRSLS